MRRDGRTFLWGALMGSLIFFLMAKTIFRLQFSNEAAVVSVGDDASALLATDRGNGVSPSPKDKPFVETEPPLPSDKPSLERKEEKEEDNEDWGKKICPSPWIQNQDDFFKYVTTISQKCKKPVKVGGAVLAFDMIDGDKWICMDDEYRIVPGNCLVYSFGLNNEFSFEDEMDQKYNCKVMGFDHTSEKENHDRSSNIHLFKLGISGTDQPEVKRYCTLLEMNGHTDTIIDYLKLDIESHEIEVFQDILTNTPNLMKNVKQIGMEIHVGQKSPELWRLFEHLECLGFRIAFSNENLVVRKLLEIGNVDEPNGTYELVWTRQHNW